MEYAGNDVFPDKAETVNDGTVRDAASVNVGIEASLDRTRWLYNRRVEAVYEAHWDIEGSSTGTGGVSGSYGDFVESGGMLFHVDAPNVEIGDVLLIDVSFTARCAGVSGSGTGRARLAAVLPGSTTVAIPGAHVRLEAATNFFPCSLSGVLVATQNGTHTIKVQAKATAGSVDISDAFTIRVIHLKR